MKTKGKDLTPKAEKTGLRLDYKQTFRVGFAFAIICLFWNAYDFVVPLLLENAYGLPNWARGLIMGLDNLLALFMLPLFGKLSDKANGKLAKRFGRRTPFILIGTLASVVLMIFVPVATLNQQKKADALQSSIEMKLNDDAFMEPLLTEWYENAVAEKKGSANFCDLNYLKQNNIDKEKFISIRFDDKLTSKKAVLNFLGEVTYYYGGEKIASLKDTAPGGSGLTYEQILEKNSQYKKFVAPGINNYVSQQIHDTYTATKEGVKSLAVYMIILLLVLIAMATFRSPAVALMPDVTPKPLRSQANAIINLCGGLGGAISFLIYTIVLFGERVENYVIIFASVAGAMLLVLAGFLALVKERKMVARCQEICREYGIDDFDEDEKLETSKFAEELIAEGDASYLLDSKPDGVTEEILDIAKAKTAKLKTPKEWWADKTDMERARLKSFWLILASIFMWCMGFNAVTSNLSIYTTKGLNLSAGIASIISGVSMALSAIAFIPVGYMAAKFGRRKTIMIGFLMAVVSFVLICFAVKANANVMIPSALFALFYLIASFGNIITTVNTLPMVTELSTSETVGQYTGYYYAATMSAQAITPMLGGLIMDYIASKYLFLYSAACIIIAIVLMIFVKYGDSKPIPKKSKLEQYGDMAD